MTGTEIALMGLLSIMIVGANVLTIAVYVFWKNARIRTLERQLNGFLNIMEEYMYAVDRETGQIWEFVLDREERKVLQ